MCASRGLTRQGCAGRHADGGPAPAADSLPGAAAPLDPAPHRRQGQRHVTVTCGRPGRAAGALPAGAAGGGLRRLRALHDPGTCAATPAVAAAAACGCLGCAACAVGWTRPMPDCGALLQASQVHEGRGDAFGWQSAAPARSTSRPAQQAAPPQAQLRHSSPARAMQHAGEDGALLGPGSRPSTLSRRAQSACSALVPGGLHTVRTPGLALLCCCSCVGKAGTAAAACCAGRTSAGPTLQALNAGLRVCRLSADSVGRASSTADLATSVEAGGVRKQSSGLARRRRCSGWPSSDDV